ncbi:MAG: hypothetical protein ACI965_002330, partial [Paraglaciecola sp.]
SLVARQGWSQELTLKYSEKMLGAMAKVTSLPGSV